MQYHVYAFNNSSVPDEVALGDNKADLKAAFARMTNNLVQMLRARNIVPRVVVESYPDGTECAEIYANDADGRRLYYAVALTEKVLA